MLDNQPATKLNELEFIKGDIYANVWQSPRILQIDAASGKVKGIIDCSSLVRRIGIISDENVLNGIFRC